MRAAALGLASLWFAGCASRAPPFEAAGWWSFEAPAAGRLLLAALPPEAPRDGVLVVVIEGDGHSHDARGRPSDDPTPNAPTGFEIARAWPGGAAWLGRLCQYVRDRDPACREADWTTARFSETAIAAADAAVSELKARAGARRIVLVGWSGGGVLAALTAAGRDDVAGLVTLAAPLDLKAWVAARGLTPLSGSQDPADLPEIAAPQLHLLGVRDRTVPAEIMTPTARRLARDHGRVAVWPEAHACCWARSADRIAALIDQTGAARE